MTKDLKEYAQLQARIKELEEKRDILKLTILGDLKKQKLDKLESAFGKFTIGSRTTYTYSEKVQELAEKLKLRKITEEEKGIAQPSVTEYLVFTAPKAS